MNDKADKQFVFMHRDLQFSLPVAHVLEIVETPPLLPFHGMLPGCLGNVSHRNYLLPVLDPTVLGTRREPAPTPSKSFLLVRHADGVFGLAMDRFVTVVAFEGLDAPRARDDSIAEDSPFVETVRAFRGNALISLSAVALARLVQRQFDCQQMMTDEEWARVANREARVEPQRRIFLCARVERVLFGIPVEHVIEVIEGYDVTPLFKLPPLVRGLINLRGQVLACLDISGDLGLPPRPLEERNQFVVLKHEEAELALCVDKVTGIRRLAPQLVQKTDMLLAGELTRFAAGVVEGADGALFVLSVAAIFESPPLQPYRRQEG